MKNYSLHKAGHEPRIVPQFLILAVLASLTACAETAIRVVDTLAAGGVDKIDVVAKDESLVTVRIV